MAHPINEHLAAYTSAFEAFQAAHDLPTEWFEQPDHVAIKCADREEYELWCRLMAPYTDENGIWAVDMDGRSLASAAIVPSLKVLGHSFDWIEIMQPRPGKETEAPFVEHTEFVVPDFDAVTRILEEQKIPFDNESNPGHAWINVVIDGLGREVKFNNRPLAEVVVNEKADGKLYKVQV